MRRLYEWIKKNALLIASIACNIIALVLHRGLCRGLGKDKQLCEDCTAEAARIGDGIDSAVCSIGAVADSVGGIEDGTAEVIGAIRGVIKEVGGVSAESQSIADIIAKYDRAAEQERNSK